MVTRDEAGWLRQYNFLNDWKIGGINSLYLRDTAHTMLGAQRSLVCLCLTVPCLISFVKYYQYTGESLAI